MKIATIEELDELLVGSIAYDADLDVMHKVWDPKTNTTFWSYLGNEKRAAFWLPGFLINEPGRDLVQEAEAAAYDHGYLIGWKDNDREWTESGTKPTEDFEPAPNPYRQETS